jgi:hypothetical protein
MTAYQVKGTINLKIIHVVKSWAQYLLNITISFEIVKKNFYIFAVAYSTDSSK